MGDESPSPPRVWVLGCSLGGARSDSEGPLARLGAWLPGGGLLHGLFRGDEGSYK